MGFIKTINYVEESPGWVSHDINLTNNGRKKAKERKRYSQACPNCGKKDVGKKLLRLQAPRMYDDL